jgi:hypothetical protein
MKQLVAIAVLALWLTPAHAVDKSDAKVPWTGWLPCKMWRQAGLPDGRTPDIQHVGIMYWSMGLLTALLPESSSEIGQQRFGEWMENYCGAHPDKTISAATLSFVDYYGATTGKTK